MSGPKPRPIKYAIKPEKSNGQFRTICDVHRELHRLLAGNTDAQALVEEAYDLGKRMAHRLREYSKKNGSDFARDAYDHE